MVVGTSFVARMYPAVVRHSGPPGRLEHRVEDRGSTHTQFQYVPLLLSLGDLKAVRKPCSLFDVAIVVYFSLSREVATAL